MRAYVIYTASVVFTVDLNGKRIEAAEIYSNTLDHLDTGLEEQSPSDWAKLHQEARSIVERNPRAAPVVWSDET